MNKAKILVADDHDLIRRGIRFLLSDNPRWEVCGEARNGLEAVTKCEQLKPQIAILDFNMPELNGLEAAKRIRNVSPQTEILMLTFDSSEQLIHAISAVGVRGYILKSDCDLELVNAVRALESHRPYFTNRAIEVMLHAKSQKQGPSGLTGSSEHLTSKEKEILRLIAEGKSTPRIADILSVSKKTIDSHRMNLMRKLQLHSVTELVRYALRNHVVAP